MNRVIRYCHVNTKDQNLDMKEKTVEKYAEEKGLMLMMYVEKVSSRNSESRAIECNESCYSKRSIN